MLNRSILSAVLAGLVYANADSVFADGKKVQNSQQEPYKKIELLSSSGETIDYKLIIDIESRGNPKAISPCGARGLMGIMPTTVVEWNKSHPSEKYSFDEMFNPEVNVKVGRWYLEERVPFFLRYFKIKDSIKNRIASYNCGIGRLEKNVNHGIQLPRETRNYFERYYQRAEKAKLVLE